MTLNDEIVKQNENLVLNDEIVKQNETLILFDEIVKQNESLVLCRQGRESSQFRMARQVPSSVWPGKFLVPDGQESS